MEPTQKLTLGRIILFGHQIQKLKSFYVENFGFNIKVDAGDYWIVLDAGPTELALHKIGPGYEPEAWKDFKVESNTKLVFYIADNLEGFRDRLVKKGVKMKDIRKIQGMNSLFCDGEDPEGNVFQIEQRLG